MTRTVHQVAELIARGTGKTASFHARQIRHWAQHGCFGMLQLRGSGPTAPALFDDVQLAMARLYAVLSGHGFNVKQLANVHACLRNMSPEAWTAVHSEFSTGFHPGLAVVVELLKRGKGEGWFLELYAKETGEVIGGSFTMKLDVTLAASGPVITVLNVSRLLRYLFQDGE